MKSLQDQLGASNDVEVARKLLQRVVKKSRGKERARLAYAAGMVVGWHSHIGGGREEQQVEAWRRLAARPPYWEPATAAAKAAASDSAAGEAASPAAAAPPPADPPEKPSAPAGRSPQPRRRTVRPRPG
ncbi:MAG: hypothetical protein U1E38_10160 [Rhodospirillales bacterium]